MYEKTTRFNKNTETYPPSLFWLGPCSSICLFQWGQSNQLC